MKTRALHLLLPAALLAVGTAARSARADDTSHLEDLLEQEVVTTASTTAEHAEEAPAFSRTISSDDLRRYGIRSVAEALDFLGVGLRTSTGLRVPLVNARGVGLADDENKRVLVLVDGVATNEPLYGSSQVGQGLGVPLELIDRIEVILGPGSTLYGSNAIQAVINVITKTAVSHEGVHVALEGSPFYDARGSLTAAHAFSVFGTPASVTAGVMYFLQDGPALTLGPQQTGTDPVSGQPSRWSRSRPADGVWGGTVENAYYTRVPGAYVRLLVGRLEVSAAANQLSYGDPATAGEFDERATGQRERRARLSAQYRLPIGLVGELSVRAFGDVFERHYDYVTSQVVQCPFPGTTTCIYGIEGRSRRAGVDVQASFDWLHDGRLTSRAGLWGATVNVAEDSDFRDFDTGADVLPPERVVPSQSFVAAAAFAEQRWRPVHWLTMMAGARFDADQRFPVVASPRGMIAVHPWETGTLKLIRAKAFRAPSYYETHGRTTGYELPSVDLQPERATSTEAVFEQRYRTHRIALGVFETDYRDVTEHAILSESEARAAFADGAVPGQYFPGVTLKQLRNRHGILSRGFTLAADSSALEGKLRFGASATGSKVEVREPTPDADEVIEIAPSVFGNGHVSYDLGGKLPVVAAAATFAGRTYVEGTDHGGFASPPPRAPMQLDVRVTLSGAVPGVAGVSYRVIAGHTFHDRVPHAVGPSISASDGAAAPELAPAQRWYGTIGLQYDF